jgi:hypothetical protein
MFLCSEFIRLDAFRGGNLFRDEVEQILVSCSFQLVTGRKRRRDRPVPPVRHPSLLRIAVSRQGSRDEPRDGSHRRVL